MKQRILLVDDDSTIQLVISRDLSKAGFQIEIVSTLKEARRRIIAQRFDAVLLDLMLPDGNGIDWIVSLRKDHPDTAIVVITGHGDIPLAVEAIKRGADNFLTKPVSLSDLKVFLQKSLELSSLRRKNTTNQLLAKSEQFHFGDSPAMKKVIKLASLAAKKNSPVMLQGQTGSGKGVLARWIHERSSRGPEPFVEINCSNLKGELFASELFGHARGAFTSAVKAKQGLIEIADGATLFLDEIGDMPLDVQAEFLKVIEQKLYRRLGEVTERKSEFRLISSSNKDLGEKVQEGNFRSDLYFRINVFPIQLPALCKRTEDLPELVRYLLGRLDAPEMEITHEVIRLLQSCPWPGNIRELKNALERALLIADGETLTPEHFDWLSANHPFAETGYHGWNLARLEEKHIRAALSHFNGNTSKTADELGISLSAMYRRLRKITGSA